MISLGVILYFISVYLLFAAAKKVECHKGDFSLYWEDRPLLSRGLSSLFMIVGTAVFALGIGLANALISSLVIWPLLASLVVLLTPLLKGSNAYMLLLGLLVLLIALIDL